MSKAIPRLAQCQSGARPWLRLSATKRDANRQRGVQARESGSRRHLNLLQARMRSLAGSPKPRGQKKPTRGHMSEPKNRIGRRSASESSPRVRRKPKRLGDRQSKKKRDDRRRQRKPDAHRNRQPNPNRWRGNLKLSQRNRIALFKTKDAANERDPDFDYAASGPEPASRRQLARYSVTLMRSTASLKVSSDVPENRWWRGLGG